jgi:hypothetical protein
MITRGIAMGCAFHVCGLETALQHGTEAQGFCEFPFSVALGNCSCPVRVVTVFPLVPEEMAEVSIFVQSETHLYATCQLDRNLLLLGYT